MSDAAEETESTKPSKRSQASTFVTSMTFATAGIHLLPSCDCDECGQQSSLPDAIRMAAIEHKRRKLETEPIKRSQVRELLQRDTDVAIWQWTLPVGAEPLLEFGNADVHRLVWVQRLRGSFFKSIGTGIIGSSHEEKQRLRLDWKEGDVVLVPSTGGKAVGWVVEKDGPKDELSGPASLIVAKIQGKSLGANDGEDENGSPDAMKTIRSICFRAIQAHSSGTELPSISGGFKIEGADAESFRRTV